MITEEMEARLRELVATQRLAVLATYNGEHPYCSLVAFAATPDLGQLLFVTSRHTRKFANLQCHGEVALLIDDRSGDETDLRRAMAATAVGRAEEVPPDQAAEARAVYLARHPQLVDFVDAPTCALVRVQVRTYHVVTRFQQVMVYEVAR